MVEQAWPGNHTLLSFDVNCEGLINMGPVGYIWENQEAGTVALYRCASESGYDHFVSTDPDCESGVTEQMLGYVLP